MERVIWPAWGKETPVLISNCLKLVIKEIPEYIEEVGFSQHLLLENRLDETYSSPFAVDLPLLSS